ncbi:CHAT domain-containing protein [Streptomyces sp. NPDC048332]|uniref:CHAT domain-containing protein n=1 Tax=Streptomyces sp. NPDC048332 TaxID=3154619 RepID=UPI003413AF5F
MSAESAARRILQQVEHAEVEQRVLEWFLGPQALAAADEVRGNITLPDGSVWGLGALALGYADWFRYLAGNESDPGALGAALLWFVAVYEQDPEQVPPGLRPLFATLAGEPDGAATEPGLAYHAAIGMTLLFQHSRHPAALPLAETLLRHAATAFGEGSLEQGICLSDLGLVLFYGFHDGAGHQALSDAVTAGRAAVVCAPGVRDEQARRHGNLGHTLRHWAETNADPVAMREAVAELRKAAELTTWNDPNRPQHGATLGSALCSAARLVSDPALRAEGIALLRDALAEPDAALTSRAAFLSDLGVALVLGSLEDGGGAQPYTEGIALCREAAATAPNAVERTVYLTNLGLLLAGHASESDDRGALDDAHQVARDALDGAPAGHPVYAQTHWTLSKVLNARHMKGGRPEDLEEALVHARRGTECVLADDLTRRVLHATGWADLLVKRAALRGGATGSGELHDATGVLRVLAGDLPARSAGRGRVLLALGRCLLVSGDDDSDDEAVDTFRKCLALPSPADDFEATARFALGAALAGRAGADADAWQQGAEEMRRALGLFPAGDPGYWECHAEYAKALLERGDATSGVELYEEAVRLMREEVESAPFSRTQRALSWSNIGLGLRGIALHTGRSELFTDVVAAHREAVALSSAEDFLHVHVLMCLGEALLSLAEFRSDSEAMGEGIEVLRAAVAASDEDTYDGASCRSALGEALRNLARLASDPLPLEESVRWHREALVMTPGPPAAMGLLGLANSLAALYRYTRDERHSAEAIHHFRAALTASPPATAEVRAGILTSLGHIQWSVARNTGDEPLMDTAVDTLRTAVSQASRTRVSMALTNLGSALMDRSRRTGNRSWMAEAVTVLRRAVQDSLPSAMDRPLHLNNLAEALRHSAALIGDTSATDEAIALLRAAMAGGHGDVVGAELAAINLGDLLLDRARANEDRHMADEARRILEEAVGRLGKEHPTRPFALQKLTLACHLVSHLAEDTSVETSRQALHRAAATARESLACTPAGDPDYATSQLMLAAAQLDRAALGDEVDLAEVVRLARGCARSPAGHSTSRLQASRVWGLASMKAGDRAEALEGYAYGVGLLPGIAPRGLGRADQEARLSGSDGMASDAAALALEAGDADRALALLEQGRGVLLGQGLENRADVSRLRDLDPARAAEFERIRDELSAPPPLSRAHDAAQDASLLAETRHALALRWDGLIAEVRELPGLENFLRPPSVPELVAAAAEGPVVVVNVSLYRCDALVVTAGAGIAVVPLPGLTLDATVTRAAEFVNGMETAYGGNGVDEAVAMMRTLSGTLGWLWDTIAAPVLGHLGLDTEPGDGEPWPRLWWCPTGWLSFLPLHAAGRGTPDSGTWVMDRAVSSYTPTLRALVRARAGLLTAAPAAPPAPLVVALADTPGAAPLPGVAREAELLAELFPGARLMAGPDATVDAVGGVLDAHPWVHFSCHGVSELLDPSQSGLVLYDGRLTVSDVATRRPRNPELAMLSACSASQGGAELSDEAVQLSSSFQLAGYPHVIGTLWPIADKLATHLTEEFYTALAEDIARGRRIDPAAALHRPVRALRDRYTQAPHLWAAHIHTGP